MNCSGNHFCYCNLFQDCGRESRHAPVVSAVMLAFPLRIAAGHVKLISPNKRGASLLWAEAGVRGSGQRAVTPTVQRQPGLAVLYTGDVRCLLHMLRLGLLNEIIHPC